jgi:hypothetical protein
MTVLHILYTGPALFLKHFGRKPFFSRILKKLKSAENTNVFRTSTSSNLDEVIKLFYNIRFV